MFWNPLKNHCPKGTQEDRAALETEIERLKMEEAVWEGLFSTSPVVGFLLVAFTDLALWLPSGAFKIVHKGFLNLGAEYHKYNTK